MSTVTSLEARVDAAETGPYRALGFNHGVYYYLARGTGQIAAISAAKHTKQSLIAIAPLSYWETRFPTKQGADWTAIADHLMRECEAEGVFDPTRLRGRGCWRERDGVVIHLGNRIIADGSVWRVPRYPSEHAIYEEARPMRGPSEDPLSDKEGRELADVCKLIRWRSPSDALLFAGLTVLAPVCGALSWRPHGWIVGSAGTGKTWVISRIMAPLMGGMAYHVQGETTEAGVRQTLGADALPIIFDEAEGNEERDKRRIQSVIGLARQSSSESGAKVIKGSAGGDAISYEIRSSFILASIGSGLKQTADATRFTVLQLTPPHQDDPEERQRAWEELQERAAHITVETGRRLVARTVELLPTILENTEVFTRAAAKHLSSQRLGDQYGALLAGAYSLISRERISPQKAAAILRQYDWTEHTDVASIADETKCLQRLLQRQTTLDGFNTRTTLTVAEVVAMANGESPLQGDNLSRDLCEDHLRRLGLRTDGSWLGVANTSEWIESALAQTPYAHSWPAVLRRLSGSQKSSGAIRFGPHYVARAVWVDLAAFDGD